MDFKKRVNEELSALQGTLCPTEYTKVSRILFLDLKDALQMTTDELQEASKYILAFQQQGYVTGLLERWVDNMVDNINFTIEVLTKGE